MVTKIIISIIGVLYLIVNGVVAYKMPAGEMKKRFITGQNVVGRIFTNIFYAPSWFLKGVKALIDGGVA